MHGQAISVSYESADLLGNVPPSRPHSRLPAAFRAAHISDRDAGERIEHRGVTRRNPPAQRGCGHDQSASRRGAACAPPLVGGDRHQHRELTRASTSAWHAASRWLPRCPPSGWQTFLSPLDHAALAAFAADEGVDHRSRDRHRLEPALGFAEIAAGLRTPRRSRWSGGQSGCARCPSALATISYGRSQGFVVRRQSGAWLIAAAKRPGARRRQRAGHNRAK